MGAWGVKPFENDDALDLMSELEAQPTWDEVRDEFENAINAGAYLEAPDASQAIAGAAIVATKLSGTNFLPEGYEDLPEKMGPMPGDLVLLASRALKRVRAENSELNDLWMEGGETGLYAEWLQTLTTIETVIDKAL